MQGHAAPAALSCSPHDDTGHQLLQILSQILRQETNVATTVPQIRSSLANFSSSCNKSFSFSRGVLESNDAEASSAGADPASKHHIPHVRVSARVRHVVLPQRRHLFHRQDRREPPLQLRVCGRLHGAPMRIQGPRWFLSTVTKKVYAGDSEYSRRCNNRSIPRNDPLRSGVCTLETQGQSGSDAVWRRGLCRRSGTQPSAASANIRHALETAITSFRSAASARPRRPARHCPRHQTAAPGHHAAPAALPRGPPPRLERIHNPVNPLARFCYQLERLVPIAKFL